MGTRGFVGFVVDGTEKIAYNHFDSYPGGLGTDVLSWLREQDVESVRERSRALRVVDPDSKPSAEDIVRLSAYADEGVATGRLNDWYVLLRETQGNPDAMLAAGVIEDGAGFPADSLYAEWGYVVNVDDGTFEVYRGFQTELHTKGRFAGRELVTYSVGTQYYPCALVASWPLSALPDDKTFIETVDPPDAAD